MASLLHVYIGSLVFLIFILFSYSFQPSSLVIAIIYSDVYKILFILTDVVNF